MKILEYSVPTWSVPAEKFYKILLVSPGRIFLSRIVFWGIVWTSLAFPADWYTVLTGAVAFILYGGLEYRAGMIDGAILAQQMIVSQLSGVTKMKSVIDEVLRKKGLE